MKTKSAWIVLFRLIRYIIDPGRWDGRLSHAFSRRSYDHDHLRHLPEVMECGCLLDQVKAAPHIWFLTLNFEKCRDHKHTRECEDQSHTITGIDIKYKSQEEDPKIIPVTPGVLHEILEEELQ